MHSCMHACSHDSEMQTCTGMSAGMLHQYICVHAGMLIRILHAVRLSCTGTCIRTSSSHAVIMYQYE